MNMLLDDWQRRNGEFAEIPIGFITGEVVDRDAVEIGENYNAARSSAIESVRHLHECGQGLIAKKARLQHGEWLPWLENNAAVLGFETRRTAARLMKMANETLASHLEPAEAVQISREIWGHDKNIALLHTGDPEWYTPAIYIEAARAVMGSIDLDPASNDLAQKVVGAGKWYGVEDDGLQQTWQGNVFLNPPYGQPEMPQFAEKLCNEVEADNVPHAIMLSNNSTDARWWHRSTEVAASICFTLGRISFYKDHDCTSQPTNGQTFFYFGENTDQFRSVFSEFGRVLLTSEAAR